jgi:hypothetical protein
MNLALFIIAILGLVLLVFAYPRLSGPWQLFLVVIVAHLWAVIIIGFASMMGR